MTKDKSEELSDAELDAASGGLKVNLNDVMITSYQTGGSADAAKHETREHVQFCYQKITTSKDG